MSHDADHVPMRRGVPRSLVAYAALWSGLAIGRATPDLHSTLWFLIAVAFSAAGALTRGAACRIALVAAVIAFGAGWFESRVYEPPAQSLRSLTRTVPAGSSVSLRGVILDTPGAPQHDPDPLSPPIADEGSVRFDLAARSLDTGEGPTPASDVVSVRVSRAAHASLRAGDCVTLTGSFEPVAAPLNPGEPDRRLAAWQDGRAGHVSVPDTDLVVPDADAAAGPLSLLLRARAALHDRARDILLGGAEPGPGRAFLAALILGETEPGLSDVRSAFARLGIAHLLAISGFHIVVMVGVALLALRAIGDLGRWEPILTAAAIALYLAILPFQAPVWRASLMVTGLLISEALGRRHDRVSTLGWLAVALTLWRPLDAWSLGFQLSFGLMAVLLWLGTPTQLRLFMPGLRGTIKRPSRFRPFTEALKGLVGSGLLCWATSAPLIALRTGILSPLAVLAGIVVLPPIVILMAGAYATLAIGVLVPSASPPASAALGHLASWTAGLINGLDSIPFSSFRLPPVSLAWSLVAMSLVLFWFARGRLRDRRLWAIAASLAAWFGIEWWCSAHLAANTALRIDTLAVGDGTCQIVRAGGNALLWDCGSPHTGVGRSLVPRAARALGIWRTPVAVITHPNLDHFNGLLDAAEPLGIRTVLVGEAFTHAAADRPKSPEAWFLAECRRRAISIRTVAAGDTLPLGEATLEFLSPPRGAQWPMDNDLSLVGLVRVTTARGPRSLLLTGDIQDQGIASVLNRSPHLHADILEAPHHGSARESAFSFVAELNPAVVLQSTGPRRADDPRWAPARSGGGRAWLCTATDGASWAEVQRDGSVRSGSFLRP